MVKAAGIILTKDEEPHIEDCLKHLRPYLDYILILDGGSTDRTVEIAKKYADKVVVREFSGSFAEERNYAQSLIPKKYKWILHVDVDEVFNEVFLRHIEEIVRECKTNSFRFPRINLTTHAYPDYQVRLLRNDGDVGWRRKLHEIPYSKSQNKPLDQASCETLDEYPIIHLERRQDIRREWWDD